MIESKTLLVEDDLMLRMDTAAMLEHAGHRVVDVASADEALAYLYDHPGEVSNICTDLHTPGHSDGLHVAEVVSRHWPHIRVVVTSGRLRPLWELPPGVKFLAKPWMIRDLLDAMGRKPRIA